MAELFESGRIVDCILLFMVLECLVLLSVRRRWRSELRPLALIVGLGAGLCLLLALRSALTGARWQVVACWLAAALAAHLGDLHGRLNPGHRSGRSPQYRLFRSAVAVLSRLLRKMRRAPMGEGARNAG